MRAGPRAGRAALHAHQHGIVPVEDAFGPLWDALGEEVESGEVVTRSHWLAGHHEGRRAVVRPGATWQAHVVEVDPPLWLGLRVQRRPPETEASVAGFPDDWVVALLRTRPEGQAVREALARLAGPWDVLVGDTFVHVGLGGEAPGDEAIEEGLRRASALAGAVEALRDHMPLPPWRTTLVEEYEELSRAHDLSIDPARLTARGFLGGLSISLHVVMSRSAAALRRGLHAVVRFGPEVEVEPAAPPPDTDDVTVHDDRVEAWLDDLPEKRGVATALLERVVEVARSKAAPGGSGPYR